jgi:hypothetical protein
MHGFFKFSYQGMILICSGFPFFHIKIGKTWFPWGCCITCICCGHIPQHLVHSVVFMVADPHHFNADLGPSPAFNFKTDPHPAYVDPDPDPASHQNDGNLRPQD